MSLHPANSPESSLETWVHTAGQEPSDEDEPPDEDEPSDEDESSDEDEPPDEEGDEAPAGELEAGAALGLLDMPFGGGEDPLG
jgi:hypothetical protein